ncbi:hypothetical protein FPY71_10070 [Aureimonas fodinaquatilis]|uniref:Uncharacterized protein n=1 Tax=Aureimonas fodinaquatilis TaxID=2565783 RepID=A0A5B0DXS8_9HYPH|nr:hypothetical protein [Aureimonas fodinaquatilis]KAA0970812.1 hypothetical protein FPY71_10070 [Aureimonas fodinaquatilis]
MLNVRRSINLRTGTMLVHIRRFGGGYVDGYFVDGPEVREEIIGSLQPLSGDEFRNLPEGLRNEAKAKIFTEAGLQSDDEIVDGVRRYKVLSVDDWQALGGYTKAILGELRASA